MSLRSTNCDRQVLKPAILSRKRKAEKELEIPSSDYPSPSSSSIASCEPSDAEMSTDENSSPDRRHCPDRIHPTATRIVSSTVVFSQFRGLASLAMPFSAACQRSCPLPELDWTEQTDLWHSMALKDDVYPRDNSFMARHPDLEPRMRAILLDWLTEVCEVYRLHRETYYLAIDYIDRFLIAKPNLPRNMLQLLGATSLFVASKMEEIYPPKLSQFAYVTDGACKEEDILRQELVLIMTLNWSLSPVTINCWMGIFMQMVFDNNNENLVGPEKYPKNLFIQISQVMDLCILDVDSLKFRYSVLCASAIAHIISKETALHVSGLTWNELLPCCSWLKPFVDVVFENGGAELKHFSDIVPNDWHNIQTHTSCLRLLDQVQENKRKMSISAANVYSPSTVLRELTPPQSSKKARLSNSMSSRV